MVLPSQLSLTTEGDSSSESQLSIAHSRRISLPTAASTSTSILPKGRVYKYCLYGEK